MSTAARFRYTLVAGATAVVIGAGFTMVGVNRYGGQDAGLSSADRPLVAVAPPESGADPGSGLLLDDAASASAGAPASTPPAATTPPGTPTRHTSKPASSKPTPRKTTPPATKKAPSTPASTAGAILDAVLADINEARGDAGLSPYTLDAKLSKASALHNQLMIDGCGLQHQCSGETGIGPRFSAQGVQWTMAGENIGDGSAGSSQAAIIGAANGITAGMLAERAPDDGHRRNLLSSAFKRIGLSVVRADGRVWMTQDFVN
jgi:uncharacterized protein YkwD